MKKEIRKMANGIMQITTVDERWYVKDDGNGNPQFVPSVTWICSYYPKGVEYFKWLANKGWDESESIKNEAGEKGSRVHHAIEKLLEGCTIKMDSKFMNNDGVETELSLDEYQCVMSFVAWFTKVKPKIIAQNVTVWSDEHGYAGTIDFICYIDEKLYIVDFKTSQHIWASHELQLSAYKRAYDPNALIAILQIGYRMNKAKYKFTELDDKFNLFLSAKEIWKNECEGQVPLQRDYPMELKLEVEDGHTPSA